MTVRRRIEPNPSRPQFMMTETVAAIASGKQRERPFRLREMHR
jgi:hypothetical protein